MVETYDIITDEGGRLVTCVKDGSNVTIQGKEGNLSLQNFMAQATNPSLARQMKGRSPKKRKKARTKTKGTAM